METSDSRHFFSFNLIWQDLGRDSMNLIHELPPTFARFKPGSFLCSLSLDAPYVPDEVGDVIPRIKIFCTGRFFVCFWEPVFSSVLRPTSLALVYSRAAA